MGQASDCLLSWRATSRDLPRNMMVEAIEHRFSLIIAQRVFQRQLIRA